jgi:phage terminase large subunit-like protein
MSEPRLDRAKLQQLYLDNPAVSEEKKREIRELLRQLGDVYDSNPLQGFYPHSLPQREFGEAQTPIQAAFAGNRFGKTTSMVVKALCQVVDEDCLPDRLKAWRYRRWKKDKVPSPAGCGRVVVPDLTSTLEGVLLPAFRKWTPKSQLKGGSFDKAWDKQKRILSFANGSWIQCMTYEMDLDKFGGSAMHFICYDEPPPKDIRTECLYRLADYGGFEMFAMTPLMGIGWIYREIYKKRERPDITVIRASIHDNPTLDQATKDRILEATDDRERQAREHGTFAHFGGMVYDAGFENNLVDPPDPKFVQTLDVVVGIDPGMRFAGFIWVGFDQEQNGFVFHEEYLEQGTTDAYRRAIVRANKRWGVKQPFYVIDPSAKNRTAVDGRNVQGELQDLGIPTAPAQNDVETGVQQVRRRLKFKKLFVSRDCRHLRDEAEEYRLKEIGRTEETADEDKFAVVKVNDHCLDALRYACMARRWLPQSKDPREPLGWQPGTAPSAKDVMRKVKHGLRERQEVGPMGSMG